MELFQMPTEESMLQVCSMAPENVYWEYSAGIGNIFKVFRIDFAWRGNYLNTPDTQRFSVKGSFDFIFRAISSCTLYLLCQTLA
jgi:hypothetical protein